MVTQLLMPKATAVWLVDNTSLSFEQIAAFCGLHPLEVQGVADGDVAGGIMGVNPVLNGQLTREEIEKAEADPNYRMKLSDPKVRVPTAKRKGPRYTPVLIGLVRRFTQARHEEEGPALYAHLAP